MIKKGNYIHIADWMVTELKLGGSELIAYALIHGFSQDGKSVFRGSISYIQEWLNCSRRSVINTLKSLSDQGLIVKNVVHGGEGRKDIIFCEYFTVASRQPLESPDSQENPNHEPQNSLDEKDIGSAEITPPIQNIDKNCNHELSEPYCTGDEKIALPIQNTQEGSEKIAPDVVQKLHQGGAKTAPDVVQKLHQGGAKIAPNNINEIHDNKFNINHNNTLKGDGCGEDSSLTSVSFSSKKQGELENQQKQKFSEKVFELCTQSGIPNCNGNFISFIQRDLRMAMDGINEFHLTEDEVFSVIKNYGEVLSLMKDRKTWWESELRLDQLFSSKSHLFMYFLPGNYDTKKFLNKNKNQKNQMSVLREASLGWDKINETEVAV